jgi:hypothetical protein
MAARSPTPFVVDVSALPPDLATIDGLARLALATRRRGGRVRLRGRNDHLRQLIRFTGLTAVLGTGAANEERVDRSIQTDARAEPARPEAGIASDALRVEPGGEPEEREERVRVEEERELADPPT